MTTNACVYSLDNIPEEIIAHAFAKTSRSAASFSAMANELNEDKSSAFHEKWVLKFGHNSVAEHAILHLAVEGASRIAIEALESCRLGSYTEQSTRYQQMSPDRVYRSDEWSSDFKHDYDLCINNLFALYASLIEKTKDAKDFKSAYDVARFALPISTLANVGVTINVRSLRRTLCKMLASKHQEVIQVANTIKTVALKKIPTLLKYVDPCHSAEIIKQTLPVLKFKPSPIKNEAPFEVRLIHHNVNLENIAKHLFYEYANTDFDNYNIPTSIIEEILGQQQWHDATYRALEHGLLEFEVTSDYGSYYDIKRHRMATIICQKSLGENGYIIPFFSFLQERGLEKTYIATMEEVFGTFSRWKDHPDAVYMLPNAARCRYSVSLNPRQSYVLIKLRGLHEEGHSSYRTIGLKIFEMCKERWPSLYSWLDKFNQNAITSEELERRYRIVHDYNSTPEQI